MNITIIGSSCSVLIFSTFISWRTGVCWIGICCTTGSCFVWLGSGSLTNCSNCSTILTTGFTAGITASSSGSKNLLIVSICLLAASDGFTCLCWFWYFLNNSCFSISGSWSFATIALLFLLFVGGKCDVCSCFLKGLFLSPLGSGPDLMSDFTTTPPPLSLKLLESILFAVSAILLTQFPPINLLGSIGPEPLS